MRSTDLAAFQGTLTRAEAKAFARLAELAPADDIVAAIDQAVAEPCGLALHESLIRPNKLVVLAVCDASKAKVTVGIATMRIKTALGVVWPELQRWYKQLARNRELATTWAAVKAYDRATFALHAIDRSTEANSDDEAVLIARIVDSPHDEALRLVLTDLWLERGDPRGELARLPADDPQACRLEEKHGARIARGVTDHAAKYTLARGFVDSVTMTAAKFAKFGEAMFRAEPIRELVLDPADDKALQQLAAIPHLALVRSLHPSFVSWGRQASALGHFAKARFDRLEHLHFSSGSVDSVRMTAPKLSVVELLGSKFTAKGLRALLETTASTLEVLELIRAEVASKSGLDKVFAIELPKLRSLRVMLADFVDDKALAAWLPRLPALRSILLASPGLAGYRAIAKHPGIDKVEIYPGTPTLDQLDALLASKSIRDLQLGDDKNPEELDALATRLLALPKSHPLKVAYLGGPAGERLKKRFPPR